MRTTFENEGDGSWAPPASPPRVRHRASRALIFFILLIMALGWGTLGRVSVEGGTERNRRRNVWCFGSARDSQISECLTREWSAFRRG